MPAILLKHECLPGGNVIKLMLPHPMDDERLDLLNSQLASTIDGKLAQHWIVDLSAVPYMGSSMLGWLVNLRHRIKVGKGTLVLCGLSPILSDLFRNSSMERLFVIKRDQKSAML